MNSKTLWALGGLLGLSLLAVSCSKPASPSGLSELQVKKVTADVSNPDPDAPYWAGVESGAVTLMGQPMVLPKPEKTLTDTVHVQAVHDGKNVAFRVRWKDPEKSESGHLGEHSDAMALEFPLRDGPLPPVMMGGKDSPVHLFHWRAQYQRDKEKGKPSVKDLYPNVSTDMYPLEFKHAPSATSAEREKFSPGTVEGNPQSYEKTGVDEIIAEGYSTSSVQEGHGSQARAIWKDGEWTLVIVRPLVIEGGSTLKPKQKGHVAFAAWQGGQGEVGSRKSVTMTWTPVEIQ